jgi:hypothetical protein
MQLGCWSKRRVHAIADRTQRSPQAVPIQSSLLEFIYFIAR